MAVGPRPLPTRMLRRFGILVLVLAVLVTGGLVGRRIYLVRTDLISAAELRTAYGAFLSPDGRNMVTDLPFSQQGPSAVAGLVTPSRCEPLTEATFGQSEPAGADGGVSTFQGGGYGLSVSLFSFRFPTRKAAAAVFDQLSTTALDCNREHLMIGEPFNLRGDLTVTPITVTDTDAAVDILFRTGVDEEYQETVVRSKNVISWEYCYRSGPALQPEHELLTALSTRLHAVDRVGG